MQRTLLLFCGILLGMTSLTTHAGSMYCGGTLVSDGVQEPLSMTEVKKVCGAPLEYRTMSNELVYDNNKNIVVLRFDTNGILQSLNTESSAGKSAQEQKIEATSEAIKEGKPLPKEPVDKRATDPKTITKGKDADSATITQGKEAAPGTITKGVDASPGNQPTSEPGSE